MSPHESGFEGWEVAIARKLSGEFLGRHGWLKGWTVDDLVQECLLHWYLVRGTYTPGRGASAKTYMGKVVRHLLDDLLDRQLTDRRKAQHISVSLEQATDEEAAAGLDVAPCEEEATFRADLESALERLSPLQRQICELLRQGYPVIQISRIMKKPRTGIYDEIKQVREAFSQEGLQEYLG